MDSSESDSGELDISENQVLIDRTPAERLPELLPKWLQGVSLGRAQIIVDQIRLALDTSAKLPNDTSLSDDFATTWVWLTACSAEPKTPDQKDAGEMGGVCSIFSVQATVFQAPSVPLIPISGPLTPQSLIHDHPVGQVAPSGHKSNAGESVTGVPLWGDTATILHGGMFTGNQGNVPTSTELESLAVPLIESFESEMRKRGVRFVQWATDPVQSTGHVESPPAPAGSVESHPQKNPVSSQTNDSDDWSPTQIHCCCEQFGMTNLATLRYLATKIQVPENLPAENTDRDAFSSQKIRENANSFHSPGSDTGQGVPRLSLEPLQWHDPLSVQQFVDAVAESYRNTLDCPLINQFRGAAQTLRSYQMAPSFDPTRWYSVRDGSGRQVGIVIMASHSKEASELVYMALAPDARKKGLGRSLFQCVVDETRQQVASQQEREEDAQQGDPTEHRLILAVDEKNHPAMKVYHEAGFQLVLRETVWGRRIEP